MINNLEKKKIVKNWFKSLQSSICKEIEKIEGKKNLLKSKKWKKSKKNDEGGGKFHILENGKIFEKVGVNFSEVYGKFSKEFKKQLPGTNKSSNFWASGISVVMHMQNPNIPAMHLIQDIFLPPMDGLVEVWMLHLVLKILNLVYGFTMN